MQTNPNHLTARAGSAARQTSSPRHGHQRSRTARRVADRALAKAAGRYISGQPGAGDELRAVVGTGRGADVLVSFLDKYRLL